MGRADGPVLQGERSLELFERLVRPPEFPVRRTDDRPQAGLHRGLIGKIEDAVVQCLVEDLGDGDVSPFRDGTGSREHVREELDHHLGFRARRLGLGAGAIRFRLLPVGVDQPPGQSRSGHVQHHEECRRDSEFDAVPSGELAEPVPHTGRSGLHGFAGPVALEFLFELLDGLVAPLPIGRDGAHRDPVQVVAKRRPEGPRVGVAFRGDLPHRVVDLSHPLARRSASRVPDHRGELGR
jgi:hypothetical protein